MKYIKLFEKFQEKDFNIEYLEDILIPILDYGFEFDDVSVGWFSSNRYFSAIRAKVNNLPSHFSLSREEMNKRRYNNFSIRLKSTDYFYYSEDFFEELQFIIDHVESKYDLKLNCIYTSSLSKHVYYKNVNIFKDIIRESGDVSVKYNKMDLMFEIK